VANSLPYVAAPALLLTVVEAAAPALSIVPAGPLRLLLPSCLCWKAILHIATKNDHDLKVANTADLAAERMGKPELRRAGLQGLVLDPLGRSSSVRTERTV
jgi:hypothetical protein